MKPPFVSRSRMVFGRGQKYRADSVWVSWHSWMRNQILTTNEHVRLRHANTLEKFYSWRKKNTEPFCQVKKRERSQVLQFLSVFGSAPVESTECFIPQGLFNLTLHLYFTHFSLRWHSEDKQTMFCEHLRKCQDGIHSITTSIQSNDKEEIYLVKQRGSYSFWRLWYFKNMPAFSFLSRFLCRDLQHEQKRHYQSVF